MSNPESKANRWRVAGNSISEKIPLSPEGMMLQPGEPNRSITYLLYVKEQTVCIAHLIPPSLQPTHLQRVSLGRFSPSITSWVERDLGGYRARYQVLVEQAKGEYFLEVNNLGTEPISVYPAEATVQTPKQPTSETELTTNTAKSALSRTWPFLTDRQIEIFSGELKAEHYKRGEVILQEGDSAEPPKDKMFLVAKGKVDVTVGGSHESSITPQSPAPYFGERALITKEPRNATVMVSEENEEVLLFSFSGDSLNKLKQLSPDLKSLIDLVIKIRDGQRVTAYDLAEAIRLPIAIQTSFKYAHNFLSRFLDLEGSSDYYIQAANNAGQQTAAAENLLIACGYLVSEYPGQGKFPEVIGEVKRLIRLATQHYERANKLHEADTLRVIEEESNLVKIVTVLAAQYVAQQTN
ncbi:MAG: cyclic nucleotide-binding domain-containing protein [Patescibacteria group bacterium]